MMSNLLKFRFLQVLFLLLFVSANLSAADSKVGKTLFITNCAQCHAKNMKDKLTGPPLGKAIENWSGDMKGIYSWVRNSQAMIAAGNARAVAVWNEYKPTQMNAFPTLKDEDIDNIFAYVDETMKGGGGTTGPKGPVVEEAKEDHTLLYGVAFFLLGALAIVLSRIINNLKKTSAEQAGETFTERSWTEALTSKGVIGFIIFALIVLGGYTTVNNAISFGRQQNYAPDQPVKFSHKTHAGLNKIDCQYCHDGARRSKSAVIPATNTCMNCHKAIKVGSQYKTAELTKIFVSTGFDPYTSQYIPNYENLKEEEVAAIFKKWIGFNYRDERKLDLEAKATGDETAFVNDQWDAIAASLKTEYKDKVQGPIEWKRVHNLPDHVYFNHSQHVTVGKVACQSCHGTVEKMEVLKQHAPLSMGWCINCHRGTEVKFKDNDFYKNYARYHEEMKKGTREKVTVEDIGGLECQKCHY